MEGRGGSVYGRGDRGHGRGGYSGGRGRDNQQYSHYQPQQQHPLWHKQQQRVQQQCPQWQNQTTQQQRVQYRPPQPQVSGGNPWAVTGRRSGGVGEGSSSSGGQQQFNAETLRQSSHSFTDRGLNADMWSLKLSEPSDTEKIVPIKRPDEGGFANIRTVNILVNHFPVKFHPESTIIHYNIVFEPEEASSRGRPVKKVSKANRSLIIEKLLADHANFSPEVIAYDGESYLFSAKPLPIGMFMVNISAEEDAKCNTYNLHVTFVRELKLHKLKDYLMKELLNLPCEVLQGMEVVMKENPRRHMVSIGKSFHPIDPSIPLHKGLLASEGFQHSLKPTSQGLALCLDYSVLAVRKRVSVLQFLKEHIELKEVSSDNFCRKRKDFENALKGLKVTVTHRRTKQKYAILGLTDQNACDISFTVEDPDGQKSPTTLRLLDYFREKYPVLHIQHRDIPCLSLGKGKRPNYVPIELCVLVEGQRYPKDYLDRYSAVLLKDMSLVSPEIRRDKICHMLQSDHGPAGGDISRSFGIDVTMNMTRVKGRVIEPPKLMLRSPHNGISYINVDQNSCQWNLVNNLVVEGKSLLRWAVLDFSSYENYDRLNGDFIEKLVRRCNRLGLHMELPMFTEKANMRSLQSIESVTGKLERVCSQAFDKYHCNLQLILCVMTKKDAGYKYIKLISETKIGVVTQCCLSKMANKGQDQYLANLGMKINAKLGGSNVELSNQLPIFTKDAGVMIIGADVNHPRPSDLSSPSIAAVVASMNWPAATKYLPRLRRQGHCVEKIEGFGHICLQLIECYEKLNEVKPRKLVIFRDGVSDGQFDMVLNEELFDLLTVMKKVDYRPSITLIVARKRHPTRLFPETSRDQGRNGNIPPGTVVDTTIVHPWEFDFYLCSHNGTIGTSKPTHYYIPFDEHGFTSDKLQKFIYDLCFTFAKCCKPVSLVPPVYYADLLAYRGRLHYDAEFEKLSSPGYSSSSSATSSSSTSANFSEYANALHADIENSMYYI